MNCIKILSGLSFLMLFLFIGCNQKKDHEDIFKNVPLDGTIKFIDSIKHQISLHAGNNFTARPILKENQYYYYERNFRDSLGNLREYLVIERRDTGDIFMEYYYYRNQLIAVSKRIFTMNVYQISNYYFRNDTLFDSHIHGPLTLISVDTLLNRGYRYLSISGDVGDKEYRKYFGKKSYPPNSMVDLVQ